MPARILGIDFGMRRMGLAVSDELGITAQGLATLERSSLRKDVEHIRLLATQYNVQKVVVGNPIGHSGGATSMSEKASAFAEKLRSRLECPVELWDERLTSAEANRMLRSAGLSIGKRQRAVDRVSAVLLLQNYLDYHANRLARQDPAGGSP